MKAIREQGRVAGVERIAVFAALNIAGALLAGRDAASTPDGDVPETIADPSRPARDTSVADPEILRRMQDINALLDTALANQERLF